MRGRADFGSDAAAVWKPSQKNLERSRLAAAMKEWGYHTLAELHAASINRPEWFWPAAASNLEVTFSRQPERVLDESKGREFPSWFMGGAFNVARSCVDRHMRVAAHADRLAVVYEGDSGNRRALTYRELDHDVNGFAQDLRTLGIEKGDRVALFMPVIPEASVAFLACAKIGAVVVPAFSGYGADALAARLKDAEAKLLVTADFTTRRGKPVGLKEIANKALEISPTIKSVVVVRSTDQSIGMVPGRDHFWGTVARPAAGVAVDTVELDPNHPLMIVYTSGTTGVPKGIVHSHLGYLLKAAIDFGYAFDVQRDDVIGWIADMGWNLGPLMVVGGLHFGATIVLTEGVPDYPDADRLWKIVARNGVTLQGIAPTAARSLMAKATDQRPQADLGTLRAFASTGEAWDKPSWGWLFEHIGQSKLPILNYTGGTEVGGGILSCYTITPQTPGSFSGPLLGMDVDVLDASGKSTQGVGELALLNTWPGMAHSFWKADARYLETYWRRWQGVWVHGDLASVDAEGYWWIHGRSDDTIKIAGRRVGPAEIESALVSDTGIAEAAVIGVPDAMKGQKIVAFVVLRPDQAALDQTRVDAAVISHVGKSLMPSLMYVVTGLPKTKNGKIMRRAIRARYLGDAPGDMSALDALSPLELIPLAPADSDRP